MRRWAARASAVAAVLVAALAARAAVGDGSVTITPQVELIRTTGGAGAGTATMKNTTGTTSYVVAVGSDASCSPAVSLAVAGGNPSVLSAGASRALSVSCPASATSGMHRCLYHATDTATGAALADVLAVCEYASSPSLSPSQTTVDFGTVAVGDAVQIPLSLTNQSATTITRLYLQTTDLAGNFQLSTPCNPDAPYCDAEILPIAQGDAATIQVKCTPQTAGAHTAQLIVATDTFQELATAVTLTCTATATTTPVLSVSPGSVTVASPIDVLSGSASSTVHIANIGGGTLLVTDVRVVDVDTGAAMDWTYSASGKCTGTFPPTCMLASGDQTDVTVHFDPSQIGTRRASLLVSYHDTIDRTRSLPLDATGEGSTLELASGATTLDMGTVAVGHPSSITIALANHGNRDTTAMLSLMPAGAPFSISPSTSAVVTPTATKAITLTCAPTSAGTFMTTFGAEANDTLGSPPIAVTVTCTGTTTGLYATPASLVFGEVRIGDGPVDRTVQLLSATAPTQVTLQGVPTLEVPSSNMTVGALSAATTPATFTATVNPQSEGDLIDHIAITDDSGNTLRVPVSGRVVKAAYTVPDMIDVGTFCVNQPTASTNVTLTSTGTATIGLQAPVLASTASPFQLTFTSPSLYPSALGAGRSATISLTPARQSSATTLGDMLAWTTDVTGKETALTAITAKFIDSGGAIAPTSLDFGKVAVHIYEDDGQRVMIQNCNSTTLMLDPPAIKAPFFIDSPNFPSMLNPNETTTFSVGFHPTRTGTFQETLVISSPQLPGTPLQVALVGIGATSGSGGSATPDGGPVSPGPSDTSFYACSCSSGTPVGGAPIAVAVVCALRPSRRRRRGAVSS